MRYIYFIFFFVLAVLCSCSSSHKIIVRGKPGTEIYSDARGDNSLGLINGKGELSVKIEDDDFVPFLFSKSEGSTDIIPFGVDTQEEQHKTSVFLEGMSYYVPPLLGFLYYLPLNARNNQKSYLLEYAPKKYQSTNEDIILTNSKNTRKVKAFSKRETNSKYTSGNTSRTKASPKFLLTDGSYEVVQVDIPTLQATLEPEGTVTVDGGKITFKIPENQFLSNKSITIINKKNNNGKIDGSDKTFQFYTSTAGDIGVCEGSAFGGVKTYGINLKVNGIDMIIWVVG